MALLVNGQLITDAMLYDEMENLKAAARQGPNAPNCCERDEEFMGYARDSMVARTLLTEQADQRGVAVPPEDVDAELEKLKEKHGGEEWFYMTFNTSKEHEGEFKQKLESHLRVQAVIDEYAADVINPTDEQIEAFYRERINDFLAPEKVHARHILKDLDHGADARTAFAEMRELREKLLDGGDFDALCAEHSSKPEAGGDLGWFGRGELVEEFEAVVFSLRPGEVSPVFLTQFGYHVAKVEGRKPSEPYPLDEIRDEVKRIYIESKRNDRMQQVVEALKKAAEVREGDEDELRAAVGECSRVTP
jgi:hypothetical protein